MSTRRLQVLALAAAVAALACRPVQRTHELAAEPDWERVTPVLPLPAVPGGLGFDLARAPVALTPEKVRLGRWLFFDPRLSSDGTVSCATCHRPEHAFSEPLPHSRGVRGQEGTRKAQTVLNSGFPVRSVYFWDGRAGSLQEQATGPLTNPVEMANTPERAVATVSGIAGYRRAFREVYGDDRLDLARITDSIAAYEVTRLSGDSAYDRFQAGDDAALAPEALRGMEIFFGRGRCSACHLGPLLADGGFHVVGIGFTGPASDPVKAFRDPGREAATKRPQDAGAFKTPTLRDLVRRAPYMHDGSSPDLEDAVRTYLVPPDAPGLDPAMREVRIDEADVAPLVAFLRSLEGAPHPDDAPPPALPR